MFFQLSIIVLTLICIYSLGVLFQKYFFEPSSFDTVTPVLLGFIGWSVIGGILFLSVAPFWVSKIVLLMAGTSIILTIYSLCKKNSIFKLNKKNLWLIGVFLFFTLVISNITNVADSSVFDTGAYHVVLVKWLKDYGVVAGIANLDPTYGAFSPVFILGALFEGIMNTENSWKVINGSIYLCHVTVVISLFMKRESRRELGVLAGYVCVLFFSRGYIASLSPDLWVSLAIPYSILLFSRSFDPDQSRLLLLIVFTTFTAWVKLSSLPLLLLPLISILYQRERFFEYTMLIKAVLWISILGLLYTAFNLVISGYLLYPISFTGIPFEWTVPVERVDEIRKHIYLWGINPSYDLNINYDGIWWLEDWFKRNFQPSLYRNEIIVFPIVIIGLVVSLLRIISMKLKYSVDIMYQLSLIGLFGAGFFFWFYGSPNIRFFSPWIWTYFGIVLALFFEVVVPFFSESFQAKSFLKYSTFLVLLYFSGHMAVESGIKSKLIQDGMWLKTYDKRDVPFKVYELENGEKVYIPTESKQPWYIPLPSSREWPVEAIGEKNRGFRPYNL